MFLLVGAGGHGRVVTEAIALSAWTTSGKISAYVDARPCNWLDGAERFASDDEALTNSSPSKVKIAIGVGGVTPEQMKVRTDLARRYIDAAFDAPAIIHPMADCNGQIGPGSQILSGAIVQPGSVVGAFCLINARAVIDHDCIIGEGTHVSLGAILCGGVTVGKNCMIGAGAVVLPYTTIPDGTLVKAATRYPR